MSVRDPGATLRQIREAAQRAQSICAKHTLESLEEDWLAKAALERCIEIVGEGVRRLPVDLRDRYPGVPWKEIVGMRDRLIHGYDDVDRRVLWDAVETDVPALLATIERILKELSLDSDIR